MNKLVARLQALGWAEKQPRWDLDNRSITYYFVKGRWCCQIESRPYRVEFYKM